MKKVILSMDEQKKYEVVKRCKPANTIKEETKTDIIQLYQKKYFNASFTHFTELLAKHENIFISPSSVSNILEAEYIHSL